AFSGYKELWRSMDGEFGAYIRAQIAKANLYAFDKGWDAGFRQTYTSTRPIATVDDMKGLKLRVPQAPIQVAFFKALGVTPTPLNSAELYKALQTHLVDGAEQALLN